MDIDAIYYILLNTSYSKEHIYGLCSQAKTANSGKAKF